MEMKKETISIGSSIEINYLPYPFSLNLGEYDRIVSDFVLKRIVEKLNTNEEA